MRWLLVVFAIAAGWSQVNAEETESVTIPLEKVWGLRIPNTRDLTSLNEAKNNTPIMLPLLKHIRDSWQDDPGVAVNGVDTVAFHQFNKHELGNEKQPELTSDAPVSLVVFTRFLGGSLELVEINQQGRTFVVKYRFTPHEAAESTQHIAIIPVGKLGKGEYLVCIERLPIERKLREAGFREPPKEWDKRISRSFRFTVK
ncbi:MAG: hypothetical protein KF688_10325 [Pirellulales bacterium]|nr:hypothetical protein [Pirellulales bacterium]